jgi:mercuric ion transport protein
VEEMKERLALGGAIAAALAASLCCVGPLLFVLLGLGAFSAAAAFEVARPYLLGAAALFLVFGFYRTYFRGSEACAPGGSCPTKTINRASRAGLWLAAAAVLAFALSPYYAGALARRLSPANTAAATQGAPSRAAVLRPATDRATFKVSGMTCAGCESTVSLALEKSPGVSRVEVSYERGEAIAEYDPGATTPEKLRDVISQAGYPAEVAR